MTPGIVVREATRLEVLEAYAIALALGNIRLALILAASIDI